jgi:glycosyltransferase involved in cell wall biosynthesis
MNAYPTEKSPSSLRIALISDWFLPRLGGIELQMRDLALTLMERGHHVEVICGVNGPAQQDGIDILRLPGPRLPGFGIAYTPGVFAALRAMIGNGRYDVLHIHAGNVAPIVHHAMQFAMRARIPAVATFHSVLTHFDLPLMLLNRMHGYSSGPISFTTVSTVAAAAMRPLTADAPIAVIPNGIDLDWWRDTPSAIVHAEPPPVEIVGVMRLHKRKRPRALVGAFAKAMEGLPVGSARLTLIGDGNEVEAVNAIADRRGIAGAINLTGALSRDAIRDVLHRSHVFALASRLESFGIAALEGLACGLPVVTMRMSGASDFLAHETNALLASDDAEFAAHLRRLIVDATFRARLAAGASRRPDGVDWADVAPRYEAEYRAAIGRITASSLVRV